MNDNSLAKAKSLGILDTALRKKDSLSQSDRVDFFKFTLNRNSSVNFKLSGLRANADLALLNATGGKIAQSKKGGNKSEQVSEQLSAGTYFVQVKSRSSQGTKYKLNGSATAEGGNSGAGSGTRNNPIDLGTLTNVPVTRSRDTAGLGGDDDVNEKFYKFQLGQISNVNIRLSQVTGDTSAWLYYDVNRNGTIDIEDTQNILDLGKGSQSSNEPISKDLPAGTYFINVNGPSLESTVLYDLAVIPTPSPTPGNIPTDPGPEEFTAYSLGALSPGGRIEARDYVGDIDATDVYRFSVGAASTVNFTSQVIIGDINDARARLFRDSNNNGLMDANEELNGFYIGTDRDPSLASRSLASGNYFLSVSASTLYDVAYSITITA